MFDDTLPSCKQCSNEKYFDLEKSLCFTDVECVANNTQIDGKTCTEP